MGVRCIFLNDLKKIPVCAKVVGYEGCTEKDPRYDSLLCLGILVLLSCASYLSCERFGHFACVMRFLCVSTHVYYTRAQVYTNTTAKTATTGVCMCVIDR